jgi:hypothetical protein
MDLNPGATPDMVRRIESSLGIRFPPDYFEFLTQANGGEGWVGQQYLQLWRVEQIPEFNEGYNASELFPGLVLIGSDGGDEAYALDVRSDKVTFVETPFIGFEEDTRKVADSFVEFLTTLSRR